MNSQTWIHWLEQGGGARWLTRAALLLGLLVLSGVVAFKQFRGPRSEETLRQAVVARSLAGGGGYATPVQFPQAHELLKRRGFAENGAAGTPELYQPPGYATVLAAAFASLPDATLAKLFANVPPPPGGFGGDYLLLAVNGVLLWLAAFQAWQLGRALFDPAAGLIAAIALLVSVGAWEHTVAVDGTPLAMVLVLAVFEAARRALVAESRRATAWWLFSGCVASAYFLTDYTAAVLVPLLAVCAWRRGRIPAAAAVLAGALVVAAPWVVRNISLTGHLVGLAAQDLALRADDPTADPEVVRGTFSAASPAVSLNKVGNKTLTALRDALQKGLWSSGGLFLTAFFVTGWLYRFRRDEANELRALATAGLLALVLAQGACNSGEGERQATAVLAPVVILFGAGFFGVLVSSSNRLAAHPRLAMAGLLVLQGIPLVHGLLEPRRAHFSYPPYYPALFQEVAGELNGRGGSEPAWMADVPAGAAWYSGREVWAQPATLRDFFAIHADTPLSALVLTPHTLNRSYFGDLSRRRGDEPSRFGDWADLYQALARGQVPARFPLARVQKVSDDTYVLLDPVRMTLR